MGWGEPDPRPAPRVALGPICQACGGTGRQPEQALGAAGRPQTGRPPAGSRALPTDLWGRLWAVLRGR